MPTRTATMQKLAFGEKLIQSGKGGGTDALLKRLKTLHTKLGALDQDFTDTKSLKSVSKQLIDTVILHHKDRGVKALAACCLADLLRLYAPDAPYTADELRDIFQFFVVQITQAFKLPAGSARPLAPSKRAPSQNTDSQQSTLLKITDIPYYTEMCYLIDNLASIKSVVLICDLPGADELMTTYFDSFVEVVRPDMNKNLIRNLVSILVEVINECETVPAGVMECILNQFDTFGERPDTPAFQLIVDVCNRTANKLNRPVYAHFSDIQLEHGRDPSPQDLKELNDSHKVLLAIFRNAPSLLSNVIPQLEENLKLADEVPLRQLSVQTLGTMFGERQQVGTGVADIAKAYPSAWRAWLGRQVDKALPVRLAWVEAAGPILINHPELRKELERQLQDRIQDSDERVRAAICKLIGSLDYETALHHVRSELLHAVGQRLCDKKPVVRTEATTALAKLWGLARSEIEANDEEAIEHFAWIPQEMLRSLHTNATNDTKAQMSVSFKTRVLPLPAKADDEQAWVDQFLLVACHLDENGLRGLDRLTGLIGYAKGMSPWRAFVTYCEQNNGGAVEGDDAQGIKDRLAFVIDTIAHLCFGDLEKARKDMETFASANDARLFKLFKALVDPQSDLATIIKSRNELLRRIEQSYTTILDTFTMLVDYAAWNVINHSSIPGLIKRLQKPVGPQPERMALVAARYLSLIAKECAPMYKSHIAELVIVLNDKKNDLLVEVALQALAAVCKWDTGAGPKDKRPIERAKQIALTGTPRQAKFASRFLAYCSDTKAAENLVSAIWRDLERGDVDQLLPLLRSCQELALSAPAAFETKTAEIIGYIMKEVMLQRSPSEEDMEDCWVEEDKLDIIDRAKLIGLKVCTHRSLGWARDANALDLVAPTFNLLSQIQKNDGQVSDTTMEGAKARCHMRLRAALCMIKLAKVRAFDKATAPHFVEVAFVMQDVNFTVRSTMLKKLLEVLPGQRLGAKWNLLPILVAQDPEVENISMAKNIMAYIIRATRQWKAEERIERVEMPLARLLYLLTQHPDLDWSSAEDLKDMARFVELFVECVAQRENIALLYTIANKLKTVCVMGEVMDEDKLRLLLESRPEDAKVKAAKGDDDEDDDMDGGDKENENGKDRGSPAAADTESSSSINLYKLSELSQIIIRNCAQRNSWPLAAFPGKIRLPRDIFNNLPSATIAHQVSGRTYLSESVASWANNFGKKSVVAVPGPRRAAAAATGGGDATTSSGEGRKRRRSGPRAGGAAAPRKKQQRRASRTDEESDEEDDEDSSDESDSDDDDGDEDDDDVAEDESEDGGGGGGDEVVMGRGGRRNAKTKAQKAVTRKKKKSKTKSKKMAKISSGSSKAVKKKAATPEDDGDESELSELSDA